jgi:homoserine dehydrogenase
LNKQIYFFQNTIKTLNNLSKDKIRDEIAVIVTVASLIILDMASRSLALKVGLFGGGVVGGGVYELIQKYTSNGRLSSLGASVHIAKICVRSLDKPRDFVIDAGSTELVTDYDSILNDSSINCVVELMGGVTHAKDVVFRAISSGKHVVTANKALIANYLPEIQKLLSENPSVR